MGADTQSILAANNWMQNLQPYNQWANNPLATINTGADIANKVQENRNMQQDLLNSQQGFIQRANLMAGGVAYSMYTDPNMDYGKAMQQIDLMGNASPFAKPMLENIRRQLTPDMSPQQVQRVLGGFAFGTLSPQTQQQMNQPTYQMTNENGATTFYAIPQTGGRNTNTAPYRAGQFFPPYQQNFPNSQGQPVPYWYAPNVPGQDGGGGGGSGGGSGGGGGSGAPGVIHPNGKPVGPNNQPRLNQPDQPPAPTTQTPPPATGGGGQQPPPPITPGQGGGGQGGSGGDGTLPIPPVPPTTIPPPQSSAPNISPPPPPPLAPTPAPNLGAPGKSAPARPAAVPPVMAPPNQPAAPSATPPPDIAPPPPNSNMVQPPFAQGGGQGSVAQATAQPPGMVQPPFAQGGGGQGQVAQVSAQPSDPRQMVAQAPNNLVVPPGASGPTPEQPGMVNRLMSAINPIGTAQAQFLPPPVGLPNNSAPPPGSGAGPGGMMPTQEILRDYTVSPQMYNADSDFVSKSQLIRFPMEQALRDLKGGETITAAGKLPLRVAEDWVRGALKGLFGVDWPVETPGNYQSLQILMDNLQSKAQIGTTSIGQLHTLLAGNPSMDRNEWANSDVLKQNLAIIDSMVAMNKQWTSMTPQQRAAVTPPGDTNYAAFVRQWGSTVDLRPFAMRYMSNDQLDRLSKDSAHMSNDEATNFLRFRQIAKNPNIAPPASGGIPGTRY